MLLLTLRGTPTMYYGDEIGMGDVFIPEERISYPREKKEPGIGVGMDPVRTPMQWTGGKNGGFSLSEPWLPVNNEVGLMNVEKERNNRFSLLRFYRKLIKIHQADPALYRCDYFPVGIYKQMLVYKRNYRDVEFMICMNLGDDWITLKPDFQWSGRVEVANNRMLEGAVLRNSVSLSGGNA